MHALIVSYSDLMLRDKGSDVQVGGSIGSCLPTDNIHKLPSMVTYCPAVHYTSTPQANCKVNTGKKISPIFSLSWTCLTFLGQYDVLFLHREVMMKSSVVYNRVGSRQYWYAIKSESRSLPKSLSDFVGYISWHIIHSTKLMKAHIGPWVHPAV